MPQNPDNLCSFLAIKPLKPKGRCRNYNVHNFLSSKKKLSSSTSTWPLNVLSVDTRKRVSLLYLHEYHRFLKFLEMDLIDAWQFKHLEIKGI